MDTALELLEKAVSVASGRLLLCSCGLCLGGCPVGWSDACLGVCPVGWSDACLGCVLWAGLMQLGCVSCGRV